jgi:dynein light intermediate chain
MHKIDLHINQRLIEEQEQQQAFLNLVRDAPQEPPEETLVKYNDPKVIAMKDRYGVFRPAQVREDEDSAIPVHEVVSVYRDLRAGNKSSDCAAKGPTKAEIRSILNKAFPPLIWRDEEKIYRRIVSSKPATHLDLLEVQEKLDKCLSENKLKPTGLSKKRRKYFNQCFDELARQEIIQCIPRGLLLLRIRDEIRMSLAAYESLYLSSAAYGVRRAIKTDMEKQKVEEEYNAIINERNQILEKIEEVRNQLQDQAERFRLNTVHAKKIFIEERDNLRRHNQNLKTQLESIVAGSKNKEA